MSIVTEKAPLVISKVTDEEFLFKQLLHCPLLIGYLEEIKHTLENGFSYDRKHVMEVFSSLKNKKLVKEGGEIRGEMYGFEIELLRLWIAEHVTIQRGFINLI